ncbi:hypothetical protein CDAR_487511 [Caerostris darwini]|uniref:Transmembrane protein n=1 Tax=Caerostris darwini TaxID=1538125 RepID=A0AAV4PWS3_9ARAC|nr:hypothetical protein CDAR_487511 [Caerostris darwini]
MDHSSSLLPCHCHLPQRDSFYHDHVTDHKVVLFKLENPFSCLSVIELSFFFLSFFFFSSMPFHPPTSKLFHRLSSAKESGKCRLGIALEQERFLCRLGLLAV